MHRFLTHRQALSAHSLIHVEFYREELIKHRRCLEHQREYFSADAIDSAERALERLMRELDRLCLQKDADRVMGRLLQEFDVVTGLSAWSDAKKVN